MLNDQINLKPFARTLRSNMTRYENILWQRIRKKQIHGVQFYRQKPMDSFILDFYAKTLNLAIEVDGGHHFTDVGLKNDANRDFHLQSLGITTLRFTNTEILYQLENVLSSIENFIVKLKLKNLPPPGSR